MAPRLLGTTNLVLMGLRIAKLRANSHSILWILFWILLFYGCPECVQGASRPNPDRMQLNFTVTEEQSSVVLGNVKEAFLSGKTYDPDTLSRIGFAFLRSEGHHLEYFSINEKQGLLMFSFRKIKDLIKDQSPV